MRSASFLIGGLFLATAFTTTAQGTFVAFDSFATDGSYDYFAAMPLGSSRTQAGFAFTPDVSGRLDSIDLPIARTTQFTPPPIQVLLARLDLNTGFPTTPIELFSSDAVPTRTQEPVAPISFKSSLAPVIEANTEYWIVVSAQGADFEWYAGTPTGEGKYFYSGEPRGEGFGVASPPSAFRITLTQVPEPTTMILATIGLAALLPFGRARRSARATLASAS